MTLKIVHRHQQICGKDACGHHHLICDGPTRCTHDGCMCWCHPGRAS